MGDEKKLRLLGYSRVSTPRQFERGHNIGEYGDRIRSYVDARGWKLAELYVESGESARGIKNRPQYLAMMKRLRSDDSIDGIIIYKLDRLHRNLRNALRFFDELEKLGKEFVSISDNFDTSTAMGRAMLKIALVFAELESEQTGERVKISMKVAKEKGHHLSQINPVFWKIDHEQKDIVPRSPGLLVPNEKMKTAYKDHYEGGISFEKLAKRYGVVTSTVLRNYQIYERWLEDRIKGFIMSPDTTITVPRTARHPLTKAQLKVREVAFNVIREDREHMEQTGKLLYPTTQSLAKACGIHHVTLCRWVREELVDIGYRTAFV